MKYPVRTTQQLAMILQGCRKQAGITQKQAASKVGMLPKTISSFETDPDKSSIASLFKLLSALDLEMVLQSKQPGQISGDEW
jgi:HTH-type transcriptional regulator / antitoxin HipB